MTTTMSTETSSVAITTVTKILTHEEQEFINRCCRVMKKLTGFEFASSAPEWLADPEGYRLQLDCYSPGLKLAVEYTGCYLHQLPDELGYFYSDVELYADVVAYINIMRDSVCRANNVGIIYINEMVDDSALSEYLRAQLHASTHVRCFMGLPIAE